MADKIIAWNQELDIPIEPERPPIDGEWCAVFKGSSLTKRQYHDIIIPDPPTHRTRISRGELIVLLEKQAYSKIYRAAYPQGNKTEDDEALFFFARAEDPTSEDGLIDVTDQTMTDALAYFKSKGYVTDTDIARVQKGVLIS